MGKHFGFGSHKAGELSAERSERSEPATPSSSSGKAPLPPQQHLHTAPHSGHSAGALHAAMPRSNLGSPCGSRPNRYSGSEDTDEQAYLIPTAVVGRLQQQSSQAAVSAASPAPVPMHGHNYSSSSIAQLSPSAPAAAPINGQSYSSSGSIMPPDSSQQQYTRLAGKMISMVNELRATGADVALELPTIVVCGQQSAGKSSVVEAICGIPLPRNQETCTRCPTEVRLSQLPPSSGAAWEATVKLRKESSSAEPSVRASAAWQLQQHLPQQPGQQQQGGNAQAQSPASRQPSNASGFLPDGTAVGQDLAALSTEVLFRAGISNPPDLPGAVAAAQVALLSQQSNSGRWSGGGGSDVRRQNSGGNADSSLAAGGAALVAGSGGSSGALKFSRETVVVEVRGAPVDLTLIDLPGIIHSVERPEDDHYKGLVADLARTYMQRPGVVIVATVTCKEDIDTQVILSMAREADPEGSRTLGVLTKPDQVEEGCHGQWLQVLAGDRYPLALGWYVVRNPNQAALVRGTSSSMARQQEEVFFNSSHPWRGLPGSSRARLGTLKLREAMSKQLVKMVTVARPALMAAAQAQLAALRVELAAMPPAAVLGDGHAEMLRLIDDVSMSIQEEVLARSQSKQFYQHLLTNFQQLKSELASSRPCFLLPRGGSGSSTSGSAGTTSSSLLAVTCALDDDLAGADEARQQQQLIHGGFGSTSRHDGSTAPATPAGNGKSSGPGSFNIFNSAGGGAGSGSDAGAGKPGLGVFIGGGGAGATAGSQTAVVLAACPHQVLLPSDGSEARRGMTLEDVRQLVERHHSVELPGFSPYSAVQDLVARHQRPWPAAVTECTAAAHRQLLQLVMLHVGRTFDRFPRAADHIRELASELLEELHSDTTAAVDSLVAMELSGAFAVCRREFSRASNQHLEGLRTLITAAGSNPALQPGNAAADGAAAGESAAKAGSSSIKRRGMSDNGASAAASQQVSGLYEPPTLLAPIPATATGPGELLSMMSVVLTYFGISCRRLADTVSMSIMHHLIGSFNSKFRARLAGQLLSLSSEAVGALLVEEPACAARRAALKQKKDLLEQAMKLMRAAG